MCATDGVARKAMYAISSARSNHLLAAGRIYRVSLCVTSEFLWNWNAGYSCRDLIGVSFSLSWRCRGIFRERMGEFMGDEKSIFLGSPTLRRVRIEHRQTAVWRIDGLSERVLRRTKIRGRVRIYDLPLVVKLSILRILWLVDLRFQKFHPVLYISRHVFWNTLPAEDARRGRARPMRFPIVFPFCA